MKLYDYIDINDLNNLIEYGMINEIHHPSVNLTMYNYSKECQAEKVWCDTTKKCRGLIVDNDNNIVARPMPKFFNYEEFEQEGSLDMIPSNESFEVYDKMDGSLGILYWIGNTPYITTKGSFDSEQGKHATHILHTKYRDVWGSLNKKLTYMFEIIYPGDPHIVRYGDIDDIFLLAVFDIENVDVEYDIKEYEGIFPLVKKFDGVKDWSRVREDIDGTNREGFVVKFESGFRLKMKYEEFLKLHYLRHNLTRKRILQYLIEDDTAPLQEAWALLDEESRIHFDGIINDLNDRFKNIWNICDDEKVGVVFATRKENAEYIKKCAYPSILFAMVFGGPVDQLIWKRVKRDLKEE